MATAPVPLVVQPDNANDRIRLNDLPADNTSFYLDYERTFVDICKIIERGEMLCWSYYRYLLMVSTFFDTKPYLSDIL